MSFSSRETKKKHKNNDIRWFFRLYNRKLYRKACEYLENNKFDDIVFDGDSISAVVHGKHDDYVAYIGVDGSKCGCPASRGRGYVCYHLIALAIFAVENEFFAAKQVIKFLGLDKLGGIRMGD